MADLLERLSTYLIENIYEHNINLLNEAKNVKNSLEKLKKVTKLPPIFNFEHVAAKHSKFYRLKNCDGEHCFDCLYNEIKLDKDKCEHSQNLTRYELAHIRYLYSIIQGNSN